MLTSTGVMRSAPRAQFVERGGHHLQCRGAHVGTIGEAEEHEHEVAAEILIGDALAGVIGEREGAADQGLPTERMSMEGSSRSRACGKSANAVRPPNQKPAKM
jgi:hypothetical protein